MNRTYVYCITWSCNLIHVLTQLASKTVFYGERDASLKYDSDDYGDHIRW